MSLCRFLLAMPPAIGLVAFHPAARAEIADYARAEVQFQRLTPEQRALLRMLLATAGYWDGAGTDRYGRKLFDAVRYAQGIFGFPATGLLTRDFIARIRDKTDPILLAWDLKEVRHPATGTPLWVPSGLGLVTETTRFGLELHNADRSLVVLFEFFAGAPPTRVYEAMLNASRRQNAEVLHKAVADDSFFFVSRKGDSRHHARYRKAEGGTVGFVLSTREGAAFHPQRLEVLMSDLFRAHFEEPERRTPPMPVRRDPPRVGSPPVASREPARPKRARAEREAEGGSSTGTGFFVSRQGDVLTNAHVVRGCASLSVSQGAVRAGSARLQAADERSDLALVKTDMRPDAVARLRAGGRLGEGVAVFGFPLSGLLSSGGNFTLGNITALSGLGDDSRHFQISAPVQPGNSGGPLLDMKGNVVGVVVGKLNALRIAGIVDDLAQNVNFAIKASVAAAFLESQNVPPPVGTALPGAARDTADIAEFAKLISVYIECRK